MFLVICTLDSPACPGDDVSGWTEVLVSSHGQSHEQNHQPDRVQRDRQGEQRLLQRIGQ